MKAWKESATLILAARNGKRYVRPSSPSNFQYNYNLLFLKRHQNSKFMPGTYVFPGGVIDPSDADLKWHKLFSSFGFDNNSFMSLLPNTNSARPDIFKSKPSELPREISLRITAIRETFEECGVLICKQSRENSSPLGWAENMEVPERVLQTWQTKIHNDAREFYTFCENFQCFPDLWSLYEWSNWMTPTYFTGRRYNAAFYTACLPSIPRAAYEETEMSDLQWDTPGDIIFSPSAILLPPPQQYEIARIAKFESIDNLLDFSIERSKMGVYLNLPVKVKLQDGTVYVLPGDSMYPKEVNFISKQVIDKTDITIREFRDMSRMKNRMEFFNLEVKEVFVQNYDSLDGHLSPMSLKNVRISCSSTKPKL